MTKISSDSLVDEYGYIIIPAFICIIVALGISDLIYSTEFTNLSEPKTVSLLVVTLGAAFILFWVVFRVAGRVLESADGVFLRVKIGWTEKTLPLSAIQSVKIQRDDENGNSLRVTVKHQSSYNGFSPDAIFEFKPNENYFRSALFRQFPISGKVKNLTDFKHLREEM